MARETVKISIRNSIILFRQNGPYSKCSRGVLILNLSITNTWPQTVRLISVQLIYHIYYFFLSFFLSLTPISHSSPTTQFHEPKSSSETTLSKEWSSAKCQIPFTSHRRLNIPATWCHGTRRTGFLPVGPSSSKFKNPVAKLG